MSVSEKALAAAEQTHTHVNIMNRVFVWGFSYNFIMGFIFANNALFPLYVEHTGGSANTIGLFMGVFSLAGVLGRPFIGTLVDRYGVRPIMMLGSLLLSAPCLGYLFFLDAGMSPIVWGLRLIQGFGWGAHMTAFMTLAAQSAPVGRRNETISKFGMSGLLATMFAPFVGEQLIHRAGLPVFFGFLVVMGILAFLVISQIRESDRPICVTGFRFSGTFHVLALRRFRLAFLMAICLSVCYSTFGSFLTPLAVERKISSFSLFFSSFSFTGIVVRFIGGRWGDRFGLPRVLLPGFFCYALGLILLQCSWSLSAVLMAGCCCGFAHGITFPAVTALGYGMAPPQYRGSAMSLVTGMMDAGNMLTAVVLGQIAEWWGYGIIFFVGAIAPLTAGCVTAANVSALRMNHEQ